LLIHILWKVERDARIDPPIRALRGSHDLDLDRGRCKSSDFLGHTLTDSGEHGGTSRKDSVGVQILENIDITLHNGLERRVGNTVHSKTCQVRQEEYLRTTEALVTNDNDVTIGKFVGLLQCRRLGCLLHFLLENDNDNAQRLLNVTNDLVAKLFTMTIQRLEVAGFSLCYFDDLLLHTQCIAILLAVAGKET